MNCRLPGIRKYRLEYIAIAVLLVYVFLTICYQDVTVAPRFGIDLVESLFDGEPLSFYYNSNLAGYNVEGANYDIGYFILYGIWDLPITILKHTIGINTASAGCLLWYKVPVILTLLLAIHEIIAIAHLLNVPGERDAEIMLISLTTATLFYPVWIACQCDIIPIALCLMATHALFEDHTRKALLWFALALLVKPFAIFWLILALLYCNRNIIRIVLHGVAAVLPWVVTRLAYEYSPSHPHARQPALTENPDVLWNLTIPIGNDSQVSVFVLLFIVLCIAAYLHRGSTIMRQDRIGFLLLLYTMWVGFAFTVSVAPYWIAYAAPAIILLLVLCNDADLLLLDLIGGLALIVHHILLTPWVYGGGMTYYYLLFHGLFTDREQAASGATVAGIVKALNIQSYEPIVNAVSLGCYIAIGYIAYRRLYREQPVRKDSESCCLSTRFVLWLRILCLFGFIGATLIALLRILHG